jgi:hypothetical protein
VLVRISLVLFALSTALVSPALSQNDADDFRHAYKGADGIPCCGKRDCVKAEITLLTEPTEPEIDLMVTYIELVDGRIVEKHALVQGVPQASVHRSEDAFGYWCHRYAQSEATMGWYGYGNRNPYARPFERCGSPDYPMKLECLRCAFVSWGT